jgi:hypothetical protein
MAKPDQPRPEERTHGEGNYEASERYNRAAKEHARTHDTEAEAREAAEDLDEHGEELREAERAGKARIAEEDPALAPPQPDSPAGR